MWHRALCCSRHFEVLLSLFSQTSPRASECSYALPHLQHPPVTSFAAHPDHFPTFPAFCRGSPLRRAAGMREGRWLLSGRRPGPRRGAERAAREPSSPRQRRAERVPAPRRPRPEAALGPRGVYFGNAGGWLPEGRRAASPGQRCSPPGGHRRAPPRRVPPPAGPPRRQPRLPAARSGGGRRAPRRAGPHQPAPALPQTTPGQGRSGFFFFNFFFSRPETFSYVYFSAAELIYELGLARAGAAGPSSGAGEGGSRWAPQPGERTSPPARHEL